ncbi:uncharacterized protein LOC128951365 [Oppia nitens]|uniref:uncharacterized protein LOC128951365 n=1 Tax=Oppia nitens TaxID=1686743 RepID=UPI0023DC97B3|nr:uncharacterized protein LOC128951365 [Oppia nitens]
MNDKNENLSAETTNITIYWDRESCPPPITGRLTNSVNVLQKLLKTVCVTERQLRLKHLVSWSSPNITDIYYDSDNWDHWLVIDNCDKYDFFYQYINKSLSDGKTELVVITGDQLLLKHIKTLKLDISGQLSIIYANLVDFEQLGFPYGIKRLPFDHLINYCNDYEKFCLSAITGLTDSIADPSFNECYSASSLQPEITMTKTDPIETNRYILINWWNHIRKLVSFLIRWFYRNQNSLCDSTEQESREPESRSQSQTTEQDMENRRKRVTKKSTNKQNKTDGQLSVDSTPNCCPSPTTTSVASAVASSNTKEFSDDSSGEDERQYEKFINDKKTIQTLEPSVQSIGSISPTSGSNGTGSSGLGSNGPGFSGPGSSSPGSSGLGSSGLGSSGLGSSGLGSSGPGSNGLEFSGPGSSSPGSSGLEFSGHGSCGPASIGPESSGPGASYSSVSLTDSPKNIKTSNKTVSYTHMFKNTFGFTSNKSDKNKSSNVDNHTNQTISNKQKELKNKKKKQTDEYSVSIDKMSDNTSGYNQYYKYKKPYESGVCGLRNLGNTCYMNSALQCLSNIPSIVEFCRNFKYFQTKSSSNSLLELFCRLIDGMWSQQSDCLSPNNFRGKVAKVLPTFAGCGQQDCSEFLRSLLNTLHEEVLLMSGIDNNTVCTDYKTFGEYLHNNQTFISENFHGFQVMQFSCSRCGHRLDENYCPFIVMNLPQIKRQDLALLKVCLVINSIGSYSLSCETYFLQLTQNEVLVSQVIKTLSQRYSDTTSHVLDDKDLIVAVIINHKIDKIYKMNDIININHLRGDLFVYQFDPLLVNHLFVSLQNDSRLIGIPLLLDINEYNTDNIIDTFIAQLAKCLEPDGKQLLANSLITNNDFETINFDPNLSVGNQLIFTKLDEHLKKYYTIKQFYHGLDDKNGERVVKLDDCINRYLSVQLMDDQQNCPKCYNRIKPTVEIHILHAPNILLLQVQDCFGQQNHYFNQSDCQFPITLNLTGHIKDTKANGAQHVYDLVAISNYSGSYSYGHYTAYARNHINKQWYEFNDSSVNQIYNERQLPSKAYILLS